MQPRQRLQRADSTVPVRLHDVNRVFAREDSEKSSMQAGGPGRRSLAKIDIVKSLSVVTGLKKAASMTSVRIANPGCQF